jgi:hypothetical protein
MHMIGIRRALYAVSLLLGFTLALQANAQFASDTGVYTTYYLTGPNVSYQVCGAVQFTVGCYGNGTMGTVHPCMRSHGRR